MNICTVEGCNIVSVAQSLCSTHYKRFKRHGDPLRGRPEHWGKAEKHELWHSHQWFKRNHQLDEKLLDFWEFVKTVGPKPKNCQLRRINNYEVLDKNNYKWTEKIPCTNKATWQREYRKRRPDRVRNNELRKCFNITLNDYNKMLEEQNGVCAICKKVDSSYANLAIDHCHKTKVIRGLLCNRCNRGLGYFKDDIEYLKQAIQYLNKG